MADMAVGELGLRERKKQATRAALVQAALELAVERGVEAVTVEDIAAAADVSPRTFFNHFASKEQAFVADGLDRSARFLAAFRARDIAEPAWPALRDAALEAFDFAEVDERQRALSEQLIRSSPTVLAELLHEFERLDQELTEEIACHTGESPSTLGPRLMATGVLAVVRAAMEAWRTGEGTAFHELLTEGFDRLAPAFTDA
jgi:AcrR family transcriptional regulator